MMDRESKHDTSIRLSDTSNDILIPVSYEDTDIDLSVSLDSMSFQDSLVSRIQIDDDANKSNKRSVNAKGKVLSSANQEVVSFLNNMFKRDGPTTNIPQFYKKSEKNNTIVLLPPINNTKVSDDDWTDIIHEKNIQNEKIFNKTQSRLLKVNETIY
jgi:hypothetical protein